LEGDVCWENGINWLFDFFEDIGGLLDWVGFDVDGVEEGVVFDTSAR